MNDDTHAAGFAEDGDRAIHGGQDDDDGGGGNDAGDAGDGDDE